MRSFILAIPKGVPSIIAILVALYCTFAKNPFGINALKVFPHAEQVGHFILYFVVALTFILDYAKSRLPHHSKINQEIVLAATSSVLALLMELGLMFYTYGYNYDLSNWAAGTAGAVLAFLFYHFWLLHPMRHYLYHSIQHHWRYQRRRKKKH